MPKQLEYLQHGKAPLLMDIVAEHQNGTVDLAYPGTLEVVVASYPAEESQILSGVTADEEQAPKEEQDPKEAILPKPTKPAKAAQ